MTGGFLALALLAPAAEAPGLKPGDELTFIGTIKEGVERPGTRFRRSQKLEIRVLVLEKKETWADVAVLTLLRRSDDAVTGAVGTITGGTPEKATPPGVRLDLVRVHADGTAHLLLPVGPAPLILDGKTPARTLPPIPLDTFAPFEFGMFPPQPPRSAPDKPWAVASADPNRSHETWQAQGSEFITAERCTLVVMNQQHANWAKPVGGHSAWHRADAAWVALDGTARKVHRVIKHRDGQAAELAAWVEVEYQLKDQTRVIGRTFDRYRRDVETAFAAAADVAPFLPDSVKNGPKPFETRLQKLDGYLTKESDASSPYREAVQAVRRQIDAARRGENVSKVSPAGGLGFAPVAPKRAAWPEPGRVAADFTAGQFRLAEHRGKPAVLVFFKPGSETTDLALAIADALNQKYGSRAAVVPLAIWSDLAAGVKDRDRRKLTVPIYDGAQAETAYGVESVPRFVVIDSAGIVKWTFAGVGAETGYSAREQLERLLPQPSRMPRPEQPVRSHPELRFWYRDHDGLPHLARGTMRLMDGDLCSRGH